MGLNSSMPDTLKKINIESQTGNTKKNIFLNFANHYITVDTLSSISFKVLVKKRSNYYFLVRLSFEFQTFAFYETDFKVFYKFKIRNYSKRLLKVIFKNIIEMDFPRIVC